MIKRFIMRAAKRRRTSKNTEIEIKKEVYRCCVCYDDFETKEYVCNSCNEFTCYKCACKIVQLRCACMYGYFNREDFFKSGEGYYNFIHRCPVCRCENMLDYNEMSDLRYQVDDVPLIHKVDCDCSFANKYGISYLTTTSKKLHFHIMEKRLPRDFLPPSHPPSLPPAQLLLPLPPPFNSPPPRLTLPLIIPNNVSPPPYPPSSPLTIDSDTNTEYSDVETVIV